MWAVVESRLHRATAIIACPEFPETGGTSIDGQFAASAKEERFAALDRDQRYEKEADIMIDSFFIGLVQAAAWTPSGSVVDGAPSGLYTGNKKAHSGLISFKKFWVYK